MSPSTVETSSRAASLVAAAQIGSIKAGIIKSPSHLMRDTVGQMLGLGVVEGIRDTYGQVQRAGMGLIPAINGNASLGVAYAGSSGSGGTVNINRIEVSVPVQVPSQVNDAELQRIGHTVTRAVAEGIRSDLIRHRTAAGVTS